MREDAIVQEVRRIRKAYAEAFDYDLDAIYRDLKAQEQKSRAEAATHASESASAAEQKTESE